MPYNRKLGFHTSEVTVMINCTLLLLSVMSTIKYNE